MLLIGKGLLVDFKRKHSDSRERLEEWISDVEESRWNGPEDVKSRYSSASFLKRNVVIFNIGGNKYRIIVVVEYQGGVVKVKWVGTHAEYDKINKRGALWN